MGVGTRSMIAQLGHSTWSPASSSSAETRVPQFRQANSIIIRSGWRIETPTTEGDHRHRRQLLQVVRQRGPVRLQRPLFDEITNPPVTGETAPTRSGALGDVANRFRPGDRDAIDYLRLGH